MNKYLVMAIVVIVAGGSFYGGMAYGKTKNTASNRAAFANGLGRQGRSAGFGQNGANFATGQIVSIDGNSLSLKLRDGGSKVIFYSGTTTVSKFAAGKVSDLVVGDPISVNGQTNSDGSITAQSIQLRPNLPNSLPNTTPAPRQ